MKKYFTDFQSTPLPDVKEDVHAWGDELVAALEENLQQIQRSITGTGQDLGDDGWKDNYAALAGAPKGSSAPTLRNFGPSGNSQQLEFGVGESVFVVWHINHDIKPGSTCYMHVHWSTDGTATDAVKWEINYTSAAGHGIGTFPTDTTVTVEEAGSGTAWQHMVTEDATGFTIPEVDSLIVAEVKRVTNGGTDNSDYVFGLFVDLHYEADRDYTPSRSPDFYEE